KKQNQWQRWSEEVIPSLISPYICYIWRSSSLQSIPDLHCTTRDYPHCSGFCCLQTLAITCDHLCLQLISSYYCNCFLAPLQLIKHGLFAYAPVAPSLAVDIHVLELVKNLFVRMTPNSTAWCEALEIFLSD
ncbi:hypothetical protein F4604DRAFT_1577604, partial [Suillus subluteus]